MPKSVYIHIPFCLKKCAYCSFLSGLNPCNASVYTKELVKEINFFYKGEKLNTIYFGGGTPSLLEIKDIERILACFNFDKKTEITLEVNPKTVDLKKLKQLRSLGINRISLGVQSFDDNLLKIINRAHSSKEALKTVENIALADFDNYSMDLIYGLPEQNLENWKKTLKIAKDINPPHISLYGLKIEQGCDFYLNPPKNLPDDDMQADMYEMALDEFKNYCHYEFSNFAYKQKYISKHNMTYWNIKPYWGFGLGASGFIRNKRYQNETDFEKYLKNSTEKKHYESSNLLEEHIFLGFRKTKGIRTDKINKLFNIDFDKKYKQQLEKYKKSGCIQKTLHGYKLTKKGIMLSNCVLCDFLDDTI